MTKYRDREIKKLLKDGAKYREIRAKTGASFDKISKIKKEITNPVVIPVTATTSQEKNPVTTQEQANQIFHNLWTEREKNHRPNTNNNPDLKYQCLEQRIYHLEQAQQTKQYTTNTPHEKPDEKHKRDELKPQPINIYNLHLHSADVQQLPSRSSNQPTEQPQEPEDESPDIIDHLIEQGPGIIMALLKIIPDIKRFHKTIKIWQQTGVYRWPPDKEDNK